MIFDYDPEEANIKTDYIGNVYGWLIVSERFRNVTKMLTEDSIQYLDVGIRDISNRNIEPLIELQMLSMSLMQLI